MSIAPKCDCGKQIYYCGQGCPKSLHDMNHANQSAGQQFTPEEMVFKVTEKSMISLESFDYVTPYAAAEVAEQYAAQQTAALCEKLKEAKVLMNVVLCDLNPEANHDDKEIMDRIIAFLNNR